MDVRVISIGTLPEHPLWNETHPVRTGHATTTLIRVKDRAVLVDPGLPGAAVAARLFERAGMRAEQITDVFLTSFKGDTCRGLEAFEHADWWISAEEREGSGVPLATLLRDAEEAESDVRATLARQVAVLQRCTPAPDSLAPGVDLFPLPGVTPGMCGLIVSTAAHTIIICGDAVPTVEHLERGMVPDRCADVDKARESLGEVLEIADWVIPGRDNITPNLSSRPF